MMNDFKLSSDKKIYSVDELRDAGLTYYKMKQLAESGRLVRLNKRYYENAEFQGEELDFYYVTAYAPRGVVCLMSAASFYHLTTYRTESVSVAVQRKARIATLPSYPPMELFYFTDERYNEGISVIRDGENEFKIYDIEKTVADIVYYRERIGIEETKEVLVNYLRRQDRKLNRLLRYAELLKGGDILKKYLEVLV